MRRFVFVIFVLSLLVTLAFVQRGSILAVRASSSIYQGDLVLTGNNVTTIEGRFDINGSIIVEENATLFLKDAFLNFTTMDKLHYNITLRSPSNGNPRLLAHNSTITSDYAMNLYLCNNSTAMIDNSTIPIPCFLYALDNSNISISLSSNVSSLMATDSSIVSIYNSTVLSMYGYDSSEVQILDSEIHYLSIASASVNCTISNLEPGLISYWSLITNCSINILPGGFTPNITIANTSVSNWMFDFYEVSNISVRNSNVWNLFVHGDLVLSLESTTCWDASAYGSSVLLINNSAITYLYAYDFSNSWLLNSTYAYLYVKGVAKVHVSWYLDVRVEDSIGQDVPSAFVRTFYPSELGLIMVSGFTDARGLVRLALPEKMMNATGEYPVGNYTVRVIYDIYSDDTTVNMTENKQITLTLEDFIIPEFPTFLILPLFMLATLLAVIVYKKRAKSDRFYKR